MRAGTGGRQVRTGGRHRGRGKVWPQLQHQHQHQERTVGAGATNRRAARGLDTTCPPQQCAAGSHNAGRLAGVSTAASHPEVQQCIPQLLQLGHAPKICPVTQHCQQALHSLITLGTVQHLTGGWVLGWGGGWVGWWGVGEQGGTHALPHGESKAQCNVFMPYEPSLAPKRAAEQRTDHQ